MRAGSARGSLGPDARRSSAISVEEDGQKENDLSARSQTLSSGSIFKKQRMSTSFFLYSVVLIECPAAAPLNLANSPALDLLTAAEQTLCSSLRIMPRQYLALKELLVREYARRGGKLRRREARELLKIDVNKTSKLWDFLHQAGFLNASVENEQASSVGGFT